MKSFEEELHFTIELGQTGQYFTISIVNDRDEDHTFLRYDLQYAPLTTTKHDSSEMQKRVYTHFT